MKRKPKQLAVKAVNNHLRIIGGQWRSRRLEFISSEDLRPTGDRIRETLFNWLAPQIQGACCLDLFSGSGALGLEALSRGAAHVTFVDHAHTAIQQIEQHLKTLGAKNASLYCDNALNWLDHNTTKQSFDIVFLDPPFSLPLLQTCCQQLANFTLLRAPAFVYLETSSVASMPTLPSNWSLYRHKTAGQVQYALCEIK